MSDRLTLKDLAQQEKQAMAPAPNSEPSDPYYAPPVESISLPSKGKVYSPDSPLYCCETVDVRAMTAKDEDILSSRVLLKKGTALSTLMKSCVTNKTVDPDSMVVGDRNALLIAIRISGYGPTYEVEVECPKCDSKFECTFDLTKLKMKPLPIDPVNLGVNVFGPFKLPVLKKDVFLRLMTGADSMEMDRIEERLRAAKGPGHEESVTLRLHAQIISIGDEKDRAKLANMVKNMPAYDSKFLRKKIDEITPGVEMLQVVECPSCAKESEVDVPLGTEFFWPSK